MTARTVLTPGWVAVHDGLIIGVGRGAPPARTTVIDLAGAYLLPGFVDLHQHGGGGAQVSSGDPQEIRRAVAFHRRHGTTRTLISLVTDQLDRMLTTVAAVARLIRAGAPGIVGIHLEGPFLNPARRGAHDSAFLLAPDLSVLRQLLAAGDGQVRVVTLAPELPGAMTLLDHLVRAGVIAAVGHTEATYDQARAAFAAGARLATHLFNAMPPLHHREPGLAGAALTDEHTICELINDGVHLHPATVRMAMAAAGPDRIALVTDATPATGTSSGSHRLGSVPLIAEADSVRLPDGSLAGSMLTMDAAVRRAVRDTGLPIVDVARAAATTPARLLGLADHTGTIAAGKAADLVVLDEELRPQAVLLDGAVVAGQLPGGAVVA